jgi:asparagine synthase (glutamine-hydrolysing)
MSRWLAGIFDPSGRIGGSGLVGALEPHSAHLLNNPPLRVAYTGQAIGTSSPLCLFDGHLDNASEIRDELGAISTPHSIEELLVAAYRRWGNELLGRLRGDFVLLLWDGERGEGLLARDQLGVRPLFLHDTGGALRFASEIRHLLALLPQRPGPDPEGIAHWVTMSRRPGVQTLYEGIRRLRPGGVLLFNRQGVREERYWRPRYEDPLDLPPAQLAAQMREALERAVHRRIAPSGATGVLMSGGLDSSSVAAVCAGQAQSQVYAYAGTFPEHPAVDESKLIEELRRALDLPGITAEVRPGGLLASALEYLDVWQMPLVSWGDFWTLPLTRAAAAEGVEIMLNGNGGDELFGPFTYLLADRCRAAHPFQAFALARELPWGAGVSRREKARLAGSMALAGALPYGMHNAVQPPLIKREAPRWLLRGTLRDLASSDDPVAWKRLDGPRWWAHAAHAITSGIEEAGVFENQRRLGASAALEMRHPILDLDLVKLGLRQPPEATFDRRFSRPVLRASMAGLLPDTVRLRPGKAWFDPLIVDCLVGADGAAVRQILLSPDAELRAYLDQDEMRRALFDTDNRLDSEPFRWMWQVWRLLTAELWLRAQASPAPDLGLRTALSDAQVSLQASSASYLFPS